LLWLLAYSPKSRGGQLLLSHTIVSSLRCILQCIVSLKFPLWLLWDCLLTSHHDPLVELPDHFRFHDWQEIIKFLPTAPERLMTRKPSLLPVSGSFAC
jgi:hypothetical protein